MRKGETALQFAGIDIGTTTISAVVLDDAENRLLDSITVENGSFIHTENDWERIQNVEIIIRKAREVLDQLLESYPEIASIGLTGQMHGIVYLNSEGEAESPLYTWQDQRGNLPEKGKTLTECIYEKTGLKAATGYGLVTHLYQSMHGLVPKEARKICTIPDYLGMQLTGRKTPLVHISMAASMGFFNARTMRFETEKLKDMGADPAVLPEVAEDFEILGTYRGKPVTVALGDNQASFLGSVGMKKNTLLLNVGTGSQLSVLSDQYFETDGIEARPLAKGTYLLAGSSLCGGRAYAILESFFRQYMEEAGYGKESQYAVLNRLALKGAEKRKEDRLAVDTRFQGTRSDPSVRGSISNLSEDNFSPAGLTYGILEGISRELYGFYEKIQAGTQIGAEKLVASGNGARRNQILQEIFSEMFHAKLELARYEEEAACGASLTWKLAREMQN